MLNAGTYRASRNSTLCALPSLFFTQKTARPLPHSFDSVFLAHPTTPSISSFSPGNSFLSLIMRFVQPLSTTKSLLLTSIFSFANKENWNSSFSPEAFCCTAYLASSVSWLLWFPLNLKQALKACPLRLQWLQNLSGIRWLPSREVTWDRQSFAKCPGLLHLKQTRGCPKLLL